MDAVGVPAVRRLDVRMSARCEREVPQRRGASDAATWRCGGAQPPDLRELRIRAWNGGSALREIIKSEKLLGSGAP